MSRDEAKATESLAALFAQVDVNANGKLEYSELTRVFGEFADQFLEFCDQDKDKEITVEEWTAAIIKDTADLSEEEFQAQWVTRMTESLAAAAPAADDGAARKALFDAHLARVSSFDGFLAALDQSGGSTPKALTAYGQTEDWTDREAEMFDAVHAMRSRIVESPSFSGEAGVLGAILFEMTMDREFQGVSSAKWLWENKNVVPFVKCDKGLCDEVDGCQLMKPNPGLDDLMKRAYSLGVFGTKMRSNINHANEAGVTAIVQQQFEVAKQIIGHGLCPIIEPEVNINSETKGEAEAQLKAAILVELNKLDESQNVMLKLTIPTEDNLYKELAEHARVVKVVALSGGYAREEANAKLKKQHMMVASFSRALMEGVQFPMSAEEFDAALGASITSIFDASKEANKE
jgi:fructose-bisphosphate aldolase class I